MGVGLAFFALFIALMQGVFCQTWDLVLPQSIVGITGSCVTVPCRFEVSKTYEKMVQNCTNGGVWRKGSPTGAVVLTAQKSRSNVIQVEVVGDLTRKNCTTTFHSLPGDNSNTYFFRLECTEELRFTFTKGVNITVGSGSSPPLLTSVSQVSEGTWVTLQCSVPVPCSTLHPSITWLPRDSSRQEQTQTHQQKVDGQTIMTSTLTFIASAGHHNQNVTCSVSYPLTAGGSTEPSAATQTLSVLYAPRFTVATLSTSSPVSEGSIVTFTCSSDANPPASLYTWYRVDTGKLTKKSEGEMLVLKVSHRDIGVYLCEAQSQRGSHRSRPVSLEVNATTVSSDSVGVIPYIICGVVLVLYILTVVVDVYKYQSLSRRLKQIELKGEHTYADLRTSNVASDYDQLQPRQPKATPPPGDSNYENLQKSPCKPEVQPK